MKSIIGIYDTHEDAVDAVKQLKNAGLAAQHISVIGRADLSDQVLAGGSTRIEAAELGVGAVMGSILGVLTGVGIFAIPGLGFLYGAGALVAAIAGFDIGLLGGGVAAVLTAIGLEAPNAERYEQLLQQGKFLVIVQGPEEEIKTADEILNVISRPLAA